MFEHGLGKADVTKAGGLALGCVGEDVGEGFLQGLMLAPIALLIKQAPPEGDDGVANGGIGLTPGEVGCHGNAGQGTRNEKVSQRAICSPLGQKINAACDQRPQNKPKI